MTLGLHLRFLSVATLAWCVFWVIGLPAYYQQYSTAFMVWFDAAALAPIAAALYFVLRRIPANRRMRQALWLAFYFTVPVAFYDWLYCGVHLRHGAAFLWRYWYLSIYYVIPWPLLPALAVFVNRREKSS